MGGALENLAAIGALALEHGTRIVQAMGEHMHGGVAPGHELTVIPDHAVERVVRLLSHGASSFELRPGPLADAGSDPTGLCFCVTGRHPVCFGPDHECALAPSRSSADSPGGPEIGVAQIHAG